MEEEIKREFQKWWKPFIKKWANVPVALAAERAYEQGWADSIAKTMEKIGNHFQSKFGKVRATSDTPMIDVCSNSEATIEAIIKRRKTCHSRKEKKSIM